MSYTIVEDDKQVYAIDENGVEICGSRQPEGHDYWQLYVTQSITRLTGLNAPPHREHFWGKSGRADSQRWVMVIAALYSLAAEQQSKAA